jgi:hypothetical protein
MIDYIGSNKDLQFGAGYLRAIATTLPSFGLWNKPQRLAQEFSIAYGNGQMGYAYTLLGEGYENFGVVAALLLPLAIAFVLQMFFMHEHFRAFLPWSPFHFPWK